MNWQEFFLDVLAIVLGFVLGKMIATYVIKPMGIPIAAGDPSVKTSRPLPSGSNRK